MPDPYLSELRYLGNRNVDFVEVAVDAGTDVSNIQVVIYNPNGTVRSTNTLGTLDNTQAGRDIYVIDAATSGTFNGLNRNGAVALVVDGTVTQFVSFDRAVNASAGPADGTTSTQIGTTGQGESLETTDNGGSYQVQTVPNPGGVPCFLAGTMILTEDGERVVDTLKPGDRIVTMDHGLQPLLWIGSRSLPTEERLHRALRPVCIPKGALAKDVPSRDLHLSPNHRVALTHPLSDVLFETKECFAAVKHMSARRGIGHASAPDRIVCYHLLFHAHQVIWANGTPTESFHPAQVGLESFDKTAREEITQVIGSASTYGPTARKVLKADEASLLMDLTGSDPVAQLAPSRFGHAA